MNEDEMPEKESEYSDRALMRSVHLLLLARELHYLKTSYEEDKIPSELKSAIKSIKLLAVKELSVSEREKMEKVLAGEGLDDLEKARISVKSQNDLPDSVFAYITPGGKKDKSGKTVPRSNRKLPIHDEAHVRNAMARFNQTQFHSAEAKQAAARKVLAAARKFGIEVGPDSYIAQTAKKIDSVSVKKSMEDLRKEMLELIDTYEAGGLDASKVKVAVDVLNRLVIEKL